MSKVSFAKKARLTGAERRVQLMNVAKEVFATHGYEATAIEEVAAKAGVSKPIVYEHFGSKEGLHAAVVQAELEALVQRVSEGIVYGTPRERFEYAVIAFMSYAQTEPAGFSVLTRDSPNGSARPGLTRVIDDLAHRVGDVFQSELEKNGYNPRMAPIYANALVGMVTQVGHWWAREKTPFSLDHVARNVAALGWMGLRHLPRDPVSVTQRQKKHAAKRRSSR